MEKLKKGVSLQVWLAYRKMGESVNGKFAESTIIKACVLMITKIYIENKPLSVDRHCIFERLTNLVDCYLNYWEDKRLNDDKRNK